MQAVGYVRVSIRDQSTYSLEYQERTVRDFAAKNGLELLEVFSDNGQSSATFERPNWRELEKFIKKYKAVQHLVIFDFDRFSRNLGEALVKIKELEEKYGVHVVSTTEPFNTNYGDTSARMLRTMKLMFAEEFLHQLRSKTKAGYVQAALKGHYVTRPPFGYKRLRIDGVPTLEPDPETAGAVKAAFAFFLSGLPIEGIRKALKADGLPAPRGNSGISRILTNPIYAGLVTVPAMGSEPERQVKGLHPPLVSEQAYWSVRNSMDGNKRVTYHANAEVPLKGVLRCHICGGMLSASNPTNKKGKTYWYYLCARDRKNLSARRIEDQLADLLDALSIGPGMLKKIETKAMQELRVYMSTRADSEAQMIKALRRAEERIATAEERFILSEGAVNKKSFDKAMGELQAQAGMIRERLRDLRTSADEYHNKINEVLVSLRDVRGMYLSLSLMGQQSFLNRVFYNSLTHDGQTFRTRAIHSVFAANLLMLKEKGLLEIEQPLEDSGETPGSTPCGNVLEHGSGLLEQLKSLHRIIRAA